jgi:hypothetical protein
MAMPDKGAKPVRWTSADMRLARNRRDRNHHGRTRQAGSKRSRTTKRGGK